MKSILLISGVMIVGGAVASSMGGCASGGSSSSTSGAGGTTASASSSSSSSGGTSTGGAGGGAASSASSSSNSSASGCPSHTQSEIQADLAKHQPLADAGVGSATIYCPFSGVDGGDNIYCDNTTQHCCDPSMGTATCNAITDECASTEMDWQCQGPTDCDVSDAGTPICCAAGGSIETGTMMNGVQCENKGSSAIKATKCAASCAGGLTLCTQDSDCPSSMHCIAFERYAAIVGGCM